jgi:hypothetical protein
MNVIVWIISILALKLSFVFRSKITNKLVVSLSLMSIIIIPDVLCHGKMVSNIVYAIGYIFIIEIWTLLLCMSCLCVQT